MTKYSPAYKERVVREYQKGVRGRGFAALSKRFKVPKSKSSKTGGKNRLKVAKQSKLLPKKLGEIGKGC